MTVTLDSDSLTTLVERTGTRFVLAMFVDLTGKLCAKLVPASAVGELETNGVGFAGYAVGAIGQQPRDPDIMAMPDPASFTPLGFVKEGLALVHCDPYVNGRPWRFAPRVILKEMLRRTAEQDVEPFVGAEVEYFLVARDKRGRLRPADPADNAAQPCYDARGVTRMFDHLAQVSAAMNDLGWANYANDHEDANGQFEQNFAFADALTTADRVITLRYLLSVLAESRGMTATFMPKPFTDRTGSGLHLHVSLWRAGQPLFSAGGDGESGETADDYGLGLSQLAYAFHRRCPGSCQRPAGDPRPDGEFVQAHRCSLDGLGRHVGAQVAFLRRQRPDPLHPGSGGQPVRTAWRRWFRQPLSWPSPVSWVPDWTASGAGSIPEHPAATTAARGRPSRRPCCMPPRRSPPTRS